MLEDEIETVDNEKKLFYKTLLIKCGIFCGILAGFFAVLVLFTLLGRNSWKNGLKKETSQVLKDNGIENIQLGNWVNIKTALTVSVSVYEAISENTENEMYAVIIRVPTLYGPVPAVYIYSDKNGAQFIGFSHIAGKTNSHIKASSENSQIEYWKNKIPVILNSKFSR